MIFRRHTLLATSLLFACAAPGLLSAQINGIPAPPSIPQNTAAAAQPSGTPAAPQKPSSLISPAVDHLGQVVSQVQLEKWKSGSRDETDDNLRSIERDLQSTLPALVTAADAQPASIAASLPVLHNMNALCAVMIRVSVTARSNAPTREAESLSGALTALQSARDTLNDQMQTLAAAQEQQLTTLQNSVAILTAKANTPPPPPPTTAKPTIKKKNKKPAVTRPAQPTAQPAAKPAQP